MRAGWLRAVHGGSLSHTHTHTHSHTHTHTHTLTHSHTHTHTSHFPYTTMHASPPPFNMQESTAGGSSSSSSSSVGSPVPEKLLQELRLQLMSSMGLQASLAWVVEGLRDTMQVGVGGVGGEVVSVEEGGVVWVW